MQLQNTCRIAGVVWWVTACAWMKACFWFSEGRFTGQGHVWNFVLMHATRWCICNRTALMLIDGMCIHGAHANSCTGMFPWCAWHDCCMYQYDFYVSMDGTWSHVPVCAHACGMTTGICPCMWHDCVYRYAPSMGHTCMNHAIIHAVTSNRSSYNPIRGHPGPSVASFTI